MPTKPTYSNIRYSHVKKSAERHHYDIDYTETCARRKSKQKNTTNEALSNERSTSLQESGTYDVKNMVVEKYAMTFTPQNC